MTVKSEKLESFKSEIELSGVPYASIGKVTKAWHQRLYWSICRNSWKKD